MIGPSLANFTLNGLEQTVEPTQVTAFDQEKSDFFAARGKFYRPGQSIVRKALRNRIVRFADDFIIVTNDRTEMDRVIKKLKLFLEDRGLEINEEKSKIIK